MQRTTLNVRVQKQIDTHRYSLAIDKREVLGPSFTVSSPRALPQLVLEPTGESRRGKACNHLPHGTNDGSSTRMFHNRLWRNDTSVGDVDALNHVPVVLYRHKA